MTIRQIVVEIHQQLTDWYPETEIESFTRILFRHYLDMTPAQIHLSQNKEMPAETESQIKSAIAQLQKNCPIQYILGETEFYGFPFEVSPEVLIPRPETEELVDWILHEYDTHTKLSVIDIGTGSGCIAVALAAGFPNADIWAADNSEAALTIAQRNALKNKVKVNCFLTDVLKDDAMGFEPDSLDVVVSNPPYIAPPEKQQMHPNVLEYEPHSALFAPDEDPLIFYKHIAAFASKFLKTGGRLFFEINEKYPCEVAEILKQHNFHEITSRKDMNDKWRMISARK